MSEAGGREMTRQELIDAWRNEREKVRMLREIIPPLIGIAESYAIQTYDRNRVTRRTIDEAQEALTATGERGN